MIEAQMMYPAAAPSQFVTLPYSPTLLLDGRFPIALMADAGFSQACETGFDAYFDEMYHGPFEHPVFINRFYSSAEIEAVLINCVLVAYRQHGERLCWCAGFALGWLSALALTDRGLAEQGLQLLLAMVRECLPSCKLIG